MRIFESEILQKFPGRRVGWMMAGKYGRHAQRIESKSEHGQRRLTPETLRPECPTQVTSQLPNALRFITGMEPTASDMLAGVEQEHGPVLQCMLGMRRHFKGQPALDLLHGPTPAVIPRHCRVSPQPTRQSQIAG